MPDDSELHRCLPKRIESRKGDRGDPHHDGTQDDLIDPPGLQEALAMAMQHASQGELIDVRPLGEALRNSKSIMCCGNQRGDNGVLT